MNISPHNKTVLVERIRSSSLYLANNHPVIYSDIRAIKILIDNWPRAYYQDYKGRVLFSYWPSAPGLSRPWTWFAFDNHCPHTHPLRDNITEFIGTREFNLEKLW